MGGILQRTGVMAMFAGLALCGTPAMGAQSQMVLNRGGATVVLEPYAPNVIRVSLGMSREQATAPPGYGFVEKPSAEGWSQEQTKEGDIDRSIRLVVTVSPNQPPKPQPV